LDSATNDVLSPYQFDYSCQPFVVAIPLYTVYRQKVQK